MSEIQAVTRGNTAYCAPAMANKTAPCARGAPGAASTAPAGAGEDLPAGPDGGATRRLARDRGRRDGTRPRRAPRTGPGSRRPPGPATDFVTAGGLWHNGRVAARRSHAGVHRDTRAGCPIRVVEKRTNDWSMNRRRSPSETMSAPGPLFTPRTQIGHDR